MSFLQSIIEWSSKNGTTKNSYFSIKILIIFISGKLINWEERKPLPYNCYCVIESISKRPKLFFALSSCHDLQRHTIEIWLLLCSRWNNDAALLFSFLIVSSIFWWQSDPRYSKRQQAAFQETILPSRDIILSYTSRSGYRILLLFSLQECKTQGRSGARRASSQDSPGGLV